jgi:hypothetical protein
LFRRTSSFALPEQERTQVNKRCECRLHLLRRDLVFDDIYIYIYIYIYLVDYLTSTAHSTSTLAGRFMVAVDNLRFVRRFASATRQSLRINTSTVTTNDNRLARLSRFLYDSTATDKQRLISSSLKTRNHARENQPTVTLPKTYQ